MPSGLDTTGRIGRAVTAELVARDADAVLVGRNGDRLRRTAADAGAVDAKVLISDSVEHMAAETGRRRPAVVANTLGHPGGHGSRRRLVLPLQRAVAAGQGVFGRSAVVSPPTRAWAA
ncbi:hypothetical protein JBE04_12360 [Streptomyces sp. PRKS01-29]|nr:hypothetical protein [Streptomyces sabulosicollis]MBI0295244.1 hypothetical protein [Streptomyces sabulosicollis]